MTWGELKTVIQTWATATLGWISDTCSIVGKWIAGTSAAAFAWINEQATLVSTWVLKIADIVKAGDYDSLPVDEISAVIVATAICAYLLYSLARGLIRLVRYKGGGETEFQHQPTAVYHGRWKVHGQQPSFWAAKRRRMWRKKLMTPEQQQKHFEKVRKQERKKLAKDKRRSTQGRPELDKEVIREESKRRL